MRPYLLVIMLCAATVSTSAADEEVWLHAELWASPRTGEAIAAMPAVREVVSRWMSGSGQVIEIRYPGGEEGLLWAEEVHDWLVALGIGSRFVRKVPGLSMQDRLGLTVRRGGEE